MIITRRARARARCGSTYGHASTTVPYRTLRPCTLTGTLKPRLSLSFFLSCAYMVFHILSSDHFFFFFFSFRAYVEASTEYRYIGATGVAVRCPRLPRRIPVSTGVGCAVATSVIASSASPRLAKLRAASRRK